MSISTPAEIHQPKRPAAWRRVLAPVLDFICVFFIAGYAIGYATGGLKDGGFQLDGKPALLLFAVMAIYFVAFMKFLGGTPWQRLLGAR